MRFTRVDETMLRAHSRITADDVCYFLYEYTSRKNYKFSATNQLITNLKHKPGHPGYRHKQNAIRSSALDLASAINEAWLLGATLVPVPPSKAVGDPEYDDRMERIARGIRQGQDVRCLVRQTVSTEAAHLSGESNRPTVEDLLAIYAIDESLAAHPPQRIGIIDDVLTAGTHFRATEIMLHRRFPDVPVVGFFIARRVFPPDAFPDFVFE